MVYLAIFQIARRNASSSSKQLAYPTIMSLLKRGRSPSVHDGVCVSFVAFPDKLHVNGSKEVGRTTSSDGLNVAVLESLGAVVDLLRSKIFLEGLIVDGEVLS